MTNHLASLPHLPNNSISQTACCAIQPPVIPHADAAYAIRPVAAVRILLHCSPLLKNSEWIWNQVTW